MLNIYVCFVASFSLAWALDEHEEERARGITINVSTHWLWCCLRYTINACDDDDAVCV